MGAFKLGKMTLGSLFKRPVTLLYPFETKPAPAGLKGHIAIDREQCILCGLCERSCTTNCLTVNKAERFWQINRYQCVQCGYCITVCPKQCLSMLPTYAEVTPTMTSERVDIPQGAGDKAEKKTDTGAPSKTAEAKAPAQSPDAASAPAPEEEPWPKADPQLQTLLSHMDDDRAHKVRIALGEMER